MFHLVFFVVLKYNTVIGFLLFPTFVGYCHRFSSFQFYYHMIDFKEARLTHLVVHKVGNKSRGEGVIASRSLYELDEEKQLVLESYFLNTFKAEEFFRFTHDASLDLNEVYSYCTRIFSGDDLLVQSVHILNHLYLQTAHPNIRQGELYVARFSNCIVEGVALDAIGIFKSENKEAFLRFGESANTLEMRIEQGVSTKRLDKGCLIFNTYAEDGYSAMLVDHISDEAQYWKDHFLRIERIQDNSFQTDAYLNLAREFCQEVIAQGEDKKEQVLFLNKSLNYFANNESFDPEAFREEVIENPEYKEKFDQYRLTYEEEQGLEHEAEFSISRYAVKNQRKHFRNLIKLDTQIHILLNTRDAAEAGQYLERGFDEERGMYYYKAYFNGEVDD